MGKVHEMTSTYGSHFRPVSNLLKLMTGSEVEENKRKYVALRINDGQFIYFVIFSFASKSSMNFNNLKLPVKGKSRVFKR